LLWLRSVLLRGTVNVLVAGVGSVLPAPSMAATSNRWDVLDGPVSASEGEEHARGAASRRHVNVEPVSLDV